MSSGYGSTEPWHLNWFWNPECVRIFDHPGAPSRPRAPPLPSQVVPVTDDNLAAFRANSSVPKALLLTKKDGTTPLFK